MYATGILLVDPSGRALFVKRAAWITEPSTWANPGGHVERGETPAEAAYREFIEEVGVRPRFRQLGVIESRWPGGRYALFIGAVTAAEARKLRHVWLNEESSAATWAPLTAPPEPLHPGLVAVWPRVLALVAEAGVAS